MIDLDLKVKEYFELEDKSEQNFAIAYSKYWYNQPLDVYKIGEVEALSFGLVKELQHLINKEMTWAELIDIVSKLTGMTDEEIGNQDLHVFCCFRSYLVSQVSEINNAESKLLGYTPDSYEVEAGIENFAKFGYYSQLRALANGDVTKLKEVEEMKYSTAFLELVYRKESEDYKERHFNLKYKKNG